MTAVTYIEKDTFIVYLEVHGFMFVRLCKHMVASEIFTNQFVLTSDLSVPLHCHPANFEVPKDLPI